MEAAAAAVFTVLSLGLAAAIFSWQRARTQATEYREAALDAAEAERLASKRADKAEAAARVLEAEDAAYRAQIHGELHAAIDRARNAEARLARIQTLATNAGPPPD